MVNELKLVVTVESTNDLAGSGCPQQLQGLIFSTSTVSWVFPS